MMFGHLIGTKNDTGSPKSVTRMVKKQLMRVTFISIQPLWGIARSAVRPHVLSFLRPRRTSVAALAALGRAGGICVSKFLHSEDDSRHGGSNCLSPQTESS